MNKRKQFLDICIKYDVDEVWVNFDHPFDREPGDLYNKGDHIAICRDIKDSLNGPTCSVIYKFFAPELNDGNEEEYLTSLNLWYSSYRLSNSDDLKEYREMIQTYTCIYKKGIGIVE